METHNIKCSSKEHKEINAICYCQDCKVYMCNKCQIFHQNLFEKHECFKLDKEINEISTKYCKEENHNIELEFYCKNHNKLCCVSCLCRIERKGKGQHKDCDVCQIEAIKDEKKNKLKENINNLENLSKTFEESINELKNIYEKIKEEKEELKMNIQKIFTKIRNVVNEREDSLLLEVDKKFDDIYFNDNIFKEIDKFPNKIKKSIEKGKEILVEEWKDEKLYSLIGDCINIENNIEKINKINENMKKCNNSKSFRLKFFPEEESKINEFLDLIKNFGDVGNLKIFNESLIIKNNLSYELNLKNWINEGNNFNAELLYRKSRDGDSYDTFHKLCDNKGPTIVLIKGKEGFIFGGYTPLKWDNHSNWKSDDKSFLFSLSNNKIFPKKKESEVSIWCGKEEGPWFAYIGFNGTGKKNMSQGEFLIKDEIFKDYKKIIPNEGKNRFFDVEEVEIYEIF